MAFPAVDAVRRSLLSFGLATAVAGVLGHGLRITEDRCCVSHGQQAFFGTVDEADMLTPSTMVPLREGQVFGWRIPVTDDSIHRWREVLIAPRAPREWRGEDLVVSGCGRVGVTERMEVAMDGVLEHRWSISAGDPEGPHELHVYVDDELRGVFHFETVALDPGGL